MMIVFAPLTSRAFQENSIVYVPELNQQMFDARNMMCAVDPRHGQYTTGAAMCRGQMSTKKVGEEMANFHSKNTVGFIEWIPNCVSRSICNGTSKGLKISVMFSLTPLVYKEFLRELINNSMVCLGERLTCIGIF